ncbi:hypothetical protein TIFTF001_038330 [Ficus carica]|uniref:Uncharacterized protein n=1 Tax=Ficus carica TaxID=3494 RepID=A0AA88EAC7_FICCA|nr:hypothetical protein TIFTF001_038330 [Ficus carica]
MIGDATRVAVRVWKDKNGRCSGSFLRVRVDDSKPTRRVVPVRVGTKGTIHWAELKFDRIPDFCGRIGLIATECLEPVAKEMIESGNFQHGDCLKEATFSRNSYGNVGNAKGGGGHHRLGSDANRIMRDRYRREEDYGGAPRSDSSCAKGLFRPKPPKRNQRHFETVSIDVESDLWDYTSAKEGVSVPRADFWGKQSELNVISNSNHSDVLGYVGDRSKLVEDDVAAMDKGSGFFTELCACASKSRDLIKTLKGLVHVHENGEGSSMESSSKTTDGGLSLAKKVEEKRVVSFQFEADASAAKGDQSKTIVRASKKQARNTTTKCRLHDGTFTTVFKKRSWKVRKKHGVEHGFRKPSWLPRASTMVFKQPSWKQKLPRRFPKTVVVCGAF